MGGGRLCQMVGLDFVICARLYQVVRGEASLDDFEAWLVENTWDQHSRLADALTLVFAERNFLKTSELLDELISAASASTSKVVCSGMSSSPSKDQAIGSTSTDGSRPLE